MRRKDFACVLLETKEGKGNWANFFKEKNREFAASVEVSESELRASFLGTNLCHVVELESNGSHVIFVYSRCIVVILSIKVALSLLPSLQEPNSNRNSMLGI